MFDCLVTNGIGRHLAWEMQEITYKKEYFPILALVLNH